MLLKYVHKVENVHLVECSGGNFIPTIHTSKRTSKKSTQFRVKTFYCKCEYENIGEF